MALDPAALHAFFAERFPHALDFGFEVVEVDAGGARLRLRTRPDHLRPGDTVSGPTLMTLADTAMYAALLARLGLDGAARTVTSSLQIHFLARPAPGELSATCRLLKVGRRSAVGAVELRGGDGALVAHATVSYALPG